MGGRSIKKKYRLFGVFLRVNRFRNPSDNVCKVSESKYESFTTKTYKTLFFKKVVLPYLGGVNLDFRQFSDIGGRSDGPLYRFPRF